MHAERPDDDFYEGTDGALRHVSNRLARKHRCCVFTPGNNLVAGPANEGPTLGLLASVSPSFAEGPATRSLPYTLMGTCFLSAVVEIPYECFIQGDYQFCCALHHKP